jgi:ribonuclease BN (tRNA processing enzyme)
VGRVARAAGVKQLVITHLMPGSVPAELVAAARLDFAGTVAVGEDLAEV